MAHMGALGLAALLALAAGDATAEIRATSSGSGC